MGRTMLKTRRKLVCPSCNAAIHFRPESDDLGTCPRCGERLVRSGRWKRRLERLDREPSTASTNTTIGSDYYSTRSTS